MLTFFIFYFFSKHENEMKNLNKFALTPILLTKQTQDFLDQVHDFLLIPPTNEKC